MSGLSLVLTQSLPFLWVIIVFQADAVASLAFNVSFPFIWKLKSYALHHVLNVIKPSSVGLKCRDVFAASAKCCRLPIWAEQPHWAWRPPSERFEGWMLGANTSRPDKARKLPLFCDWEVESVACGKVWADRTLWKMVTWYLSLNPLWDGHLIRDKWVNTYQVLNV